MLLFKKSSVPKIKYMLKLMLPIITSQAAIIGMSFFDTAMSGNYSSADLAGVAVGGNVWMIVLTTISGILMAAMPLIANLLGAGNKAEITRVVRKGICLALAFDVVLIAAAVVVLPSLLASMELEPKVYEVAVGYLMAIGVGTPAFFVNVLLRALVDTLGYTNKSMKIYLAALPINAALNYCFIYGACGLPAFGGVGAGITTALTYWLLFFMYLYNVCCVKPFKEYGIFGGQVMELDDKAAADKTAGKAEHISYLAYLKMGVPLGLSIMLETSVFGVTAFLVAKFGTVALAAHQAAVNFSSLIYMIPLGFSLASTIIIGFEYGAKNYRALKLYTRLCLEMSCTMGVLYIIIEIFTCHQIASLYSNDGAVTGLIANLILLACIWQLGDMISAPLQGITRGMKDVNATLIAAGIAYWGICLPLGYLLDYHYNLGVYSYWFSLDAGVLVSAAVMLIRLRFDMQKLVV